MKIVIGKPVEKPKSSYIVRVEVMFGDADGYDTFEIGPFNEVGAFEPKWGKDEGKRTIYQLIEVLERIGDESPREWKEFREVEGFEEWLEGSWPGDPQGDYQYPGALEGYSVVWFDENHVEHDCKVVF